ncbi:hypothetical protein [Haloarcula marina]|uniref:hypothetical protein n=1 Tax=Haloarcula marina TaxID=2961574 RepID=UPI0020B7C83A|nr:hypothetical protein [Halomicroarcula marina]
MAARLLSGVFVLVLVAAVAVGPLGVAVGESPTTPDEATVTVESVPTDTLTLDRGRFGSGRYHLDAPPAVVTAANVSGTPSVRYVIDVPGLWMTATTRRDLAGREGRLALAASPATVSPDRVDRRRYNATVAVWVRTGSRDRDLLQRRITVEVES